MRKSYALIGGLALLAILGAGCVKTSGVTLSTNSSSNAATKKMPKYFGTTETYTNEKVGIKFDFATGGKDINVMDEDPTKADYSDARSVQYYSDDKSKTMLKGDYFVDMYIYEHAKNKKLSLACVDLLVNPTTKTFFGTTVYTGMEKVSAYGYPEPTQAVCFQRSDYDFVMHGNEELDKESKLPIIYDSFALTR